MKKGLCLDKYFSFSKCCSKLVHSLYTNLSNIYIENCNYIKLRFSFAFSNITIFKILAALRYLRSISRSPSCSSYHLTCTVVRTEKYLVLSRFLRTFLLYTFSVLLHPHFCSFQSLDFTPSPPNVFIVTHSAIGI